MEPSSEKSSRPQLKRIIPDFILVWLDECFNEANDEHYCHAVSELQKVVKTVQVFNDADECIGFIRDNSEQMLLIIIAENFAENIIPIVQNLIHVNRVYILYKHTPQHEHWSRQYSKVKDSFPDTTSMVEALKQLFKRLHRNNIPISIVKPDSTTTKKGLDQLDQSYMYTQILKEIILEIKFDEKHIHEFYTYCCQHYIGNPIGLQKIERFVKEYNRQDAIRWYTSESFLYPIVNKALRVMEVDLIIAIGFFLQDLHQNIADLHAKQLHESNRPSSLTVYRGQGLSLTDFDALQKAKGGLLSFNSFLSTSFNRQVAHLLAESNAADANLVGVLFEISGETSNSTACFANVRDISAHQDEEEILFSMHSVFRVNDIESLKSSNRLWRVKLTFTTDNDSQLTVLTQYISKETASYNGWYRLALFLLKMKQIHTAEQLYKKLLDSTVDDDEKTTCYHNIGQVYSLMGEYSKALSNYETALEILQKSRPEDHLNIATFYNNIGLVYCKMADYSEALSNCEQALEIQQKSLPQDHLHIAVSYMNIGSVYCDIGEYSKALSNYEKATEIRQKSLPQDHPDVAGSYNNIGSVYSQMGEYSKALSNYKQALEI